MKKVCASLAVCAALVLSFSNNVYAYLDPGAGSMLLQALIAGVAGGLLLIRAYWGKFKSLLRSKEVLKRIPLAKILLRKFWS